MVEIAKKWMEQMGIRNTQYIIARHHDTKHPHCHLVFNRIDNEGNLILTVMKEYAMQKFAVL